MSQDVYYELFHNIIIERPGRLDYVRKAFSMLPALDNPHILDIGCGTGEPTLELARLSEGIITAVDINQRALDEFERKVIEQNYSDTIKIINRSMHDLNFPSEHFHIIWSEGSIFIIGFSEGLSQWKKFIKPLVKWGIPLTALGVLLHFWFHGPHVVSGGEGGEK